MSRITADLADTDSRSGLAAIVAEREGAEADAAKAAAARYYADERAASEAAWRAATESTYGGRHDADTLAAACRSALSQALRGYRMRVTEDDYADLSARLMVAALEQGARAEAEAGEGAAYLAEYRWLRILRKRIAARPAVHPDRMADLKRQADREAARLADRRRFPRVDAIGGWLYGAAKRMLADHAEDGQRTFYGETPDTEAQPAKYGTGLTADDLADAIGALTGEPLPERAHLALRQATTPRKANGKAESDADSTAALAAEAGKSVATLKKTLQRGRADLAAIVERYTLRAIVAEAVGAEAYAVPEGIDAASWAAIVRAVQAWQETERLMGERPTRHASDSAWAPHYGTASSLPHREAAQAINAHRAAIGRAVGTLRAGSIHDSRTGTAIPAPARRSVPAWARAAKADSLEAYAVEQAQRARAAHADPGTRWQARMLADLGKRAAGRARSLRAV